MTVTEVIRAAMSLTPEERARVADALFELGEGEESEIAAEWALIATRRAEEITSGAVGTLTRDEVNEYLDARAVDRS
ncbi:addiction module protein [Salana multivorans]